jgi:dTDP-4-dehydrorhamnose 3,5-epimerase
MDWKEGKIEGVDIRQPQKHADERGWLAEVFRSDEASPDLRPAMGYISVTHPGLTRGPHEHHEQTDIFALFGPGTFVLKLWDHRPDSPTYGNMTTVTGGEDNPVIVVVPPRVVHGYKNISSKDAWVMNMPNRLFAGKGKQDPVDEIRHENSEDCDFVFD